MPNQQWANRSSRERRREERKRHQLFPRATLTVEAAQLGKPQNTTRTSLGVPWRPGRSQHPPGPASRFPSPPGPPRYQNSSADLRHAYGALSECGSVIKQHALAGQTSATNPASRTPRHEPRVRVTDPHHVPTSRTPRPRRTPRHGPRVLVAKPISRTPRPRHGPHWHFTDPASRSDTDPRRHAPRPRHGLASEPQTPRDGPRVTDPASRTPHDQSF
jgi:hypothetical protein